MKRCSGCKQDLPDEAFYRNAARKSGFQSDCKVCHAKRVRTRRRTRSAWIQALKKTLQCEKCGEKHPACLQFHHKDPSQKTLAIAMAVHAEWSMDRLKQEVDKCQVLCANCHFKEHATENGQESG